MKHPWLIFLALALSLTSPLALAGPASKESVSRLMHKTGAGNMGVQVFQQMLPALKKMVPDAPEDFWAEVMSEVDANTIVELVIPVYQKYLTEQDIRAINAFYDSEAGKKLIEVQPAIMQESMLIGQQWGKEVARGVIEKYRTRTGANQ